MQELDVTFWKRTREEIRQDLFDAGMESVRLIGECIEKNMYTPDMQRLIYEREKNKIRFLKEDLERCNRALLGVK